MEKEEFEARLQDVKQCAVPDFGVKDTSLIESIIGDKNLGTKDSPGNEESPEKP
jgi:hypothetical protein